MSNGDWYARVYGTIPDDPKFATVYDNDHRLATWLRLLLAAEAAFPASAPIPRNTDQRVFNHLASVGLVDRTGENRFLMHGLIAERSQRSISNRIGGLARARDATRVSGRFVREPTSIAGIAGTSDSPASTRRDETRRDEHRARDDEPLKTTTNGVETCARCHKPFGPDLIAGMMVVDPESNLVLWCTACSEATGGNLTAKFAERFRAS